MTMKRTLLPALAIAVLCALAASPAMAAVVIGPFCAFPIDCGAGCVCGSTCADTITGNANNNCIKANADDDTVYGEAGNDSLFGEGGDDTLFGGSGDDSLDGGNGSDQLNGDSGAFDVCVNGESLTGCP